MTRSAAKAPIDRPESPRADDERKGAEASVRQGGRRHRWRFRRVGGLEQVALDTGEDLARLETLDQKLWVALACPTRGIDLDPRTLDFLDLDRDGRVRAPDLLAALRWCAVRVRDLGELIPGADRLQLSALHPDTPEGRTLLAAARRILEHLGKPEAVSVSAADVADTTRVFERTRFNGDGVVPPDAAEDPEAQQLILDVIACAGGVADRSGRPGIDQARLDAFFADLGVYAAWAARGETPEVAVLGAGTAAAFESLRAVRAKVDDFFLRCRFAAFDPRAAAPMNRSEPDIAALAAKDLGASRGEVAGFPVARVEPGGALPLGGPVNPAWGAALAALRRDLVAPVFGGDKAALAEDEWDALRATVAPYEAWLAEKPAQCVERLGLPRVRALLAGGARASVESLLARDRALEKEALAIDDVVRLVHYRRDLYRLLRNFVSFEDFYDGGEPAIFQAGTLYLDGRSCSLCVRVEDPAAHAALASPSRMYLAYCECRRNGEAMKIASCFTQGDSDHLMVGRNGLFYDRHGRDWDATIVKVVENPISIRQAFWAPYKKVMRAIEDQVARLAAAREEEVQARLTASVHGVSSAAAAGKSAAAPMDVARMVGIIAALGVGAGALGTMLGGLVSGFLGLEPWWSKLVAVAGVLLTISGPSMLVAWVKLRQRTLGPVLDATGWAVNGRVQVNLPLGAALTHAATLPRGASRSFADPFEDKTSQRRRRLLCAAAVLALAAFLGIRHRDAISAWRRALPRAETPALSPAPQSPPSPAR